MLGLRKLWRGVSTSFWFAPSIMALAAIALSFATVALDSGPIGQETSQQLGWLWSGGADGARALLSTIASSMITVAGTVFSITIAALTLASSQFGPRLLRNFTRDTGNQIVLGTFIATFLYCLLVLRTVRSHDEGNFVPSLSVTCGVLFALASLGVLIYFIHHVATAIQAESLIALVGDELKQDIKKIAPPAPAGPGDADRTHAAVVPERAAWVIRAAYSGYVQQIDRDGLIKAAEKGNFLIQLVSRPGDFTSHSNILMHVWAPGDHLSGEQVETLTNAVTQGSRRTPAQDVRYGVRQLTEIAARALSPGINDPFTAMSCTDWLADGLAEIAARETASGVSRDGDGRPRLIEEIIGFAELVQLSFEPLRTYGSGTGMVVDHILTVLARLGALTEGEANKSAVMLEAEHAARTAGDSLESDEDLKRVQRSLDQVRAALANARRA